MFSQEVLDLNSLVNRMSEMLLGVLRDEMEFVVRLDPRRQVVWSAGPWADRASDYESRSQCSRCHAAGWDAHGRCTMHVNMTPVGATYSSSTVPAGDYVILSVADTGIGMDADTQSRIFEPFFSTKSKDEGTGLGLSVVYNIAARASGAAVSVRVSSEVGRGATLQVFFPRIATPPKVEPVRPAVKAKHTGMETILVAEDQPDLRWMICQFLQELGYSVLEAKDGGDAVALAEQYKEHDRRPVDRHRDATCAWYRKSLGRAVGVRVKADYFSCPGTRKA